MMETFSAVMCFAVAFSLAWIIRQTLGGSCRASLFFRLFLVSIAVTYVLKGLSHLNGHLHTTPVELLCDAGLFGLFVTVIVFHWRRFERL